MQEFLDGVVENIRDSQSPIMSGRDVVFGGASIHNREPFLSDTLKQL